MPDIQVPHTASLQLQVRPTRAPEPIDQSLRFQLVFDALMKPKALEWREMEFECLDEHSIPPPPQTILQQTPLDLSESQQGKSNSQDQVGQISPIPPPVVPVCIASYSADVNAVQVTREK